VINRFVLALAGLVVLAPQVSVFAQSGQLPALRERSESNGLVQAASSAIQPAAIVRRLSVDDAVMLALERTTCTRGPKRHFSFTTVVSEDTERLSPTTEITEFARRPCASTTIASSGSSLPQMF